MEVEVDDAGIYAQRLQQLFGRIQSDWREERVDGCEIPLYCGGEFAAQKCELNPNLNPLIETSGDTLTIGFNAEGLVWLTVPQLAEITVCTSYEAETGACS